MKTRTNQPIELMSTASIENLSDSFLNELKAGDIITKQTGDMKHRYVVSYKEEKHGICLTYVDCGYMETISYDYTNGHWVFNSKDVIEVEDATSLNNKIDAKQDTLVSGTNIKTINDESVLGSGNIALSFKLYAHNIKINDSSLEIRFTIYNSSSTAFDLASLITLFINRNINTSAKGFFVGGTYKSGSANYLTGSLFYYNDTSSLRLYTYQVGVSTPSPTNVDITSSATLTDNVFEM